MIAHAGTSAPTTARSTSYYNLLTDAFLHGQTRLLVKPSAELLALPDPYDPSANRAYRMQDALLYKGGYYLYWGLSPVFLAYLPVRVLSGRYLTDSTACIAFAALGLLAYASLLIAIRRDYVPASSRWTTIALIFFLAFGTMMPFLLRRHLIYEVAITCAYFLSAVFLLAIYRGAYRGALHRGWIFASGVALGLVFLSRPNVAVCIVTTGVACFLYAPRGRRGGMPAGPLLGLALGPLVVCVTVQALYNWLRFGSATEYGLRYQLTMISMPGYQFISWPRGLSSALYIFFNLPIFSTHLPFVLARSDGLIGPLRLAAAALRPYAPDFHVEPFIGILVAVPLLFTILMAPFVRWRAPQERLSWFFKSILAAAAFQIAFICVVFAPVTRYEIDFMPMLLFAVAILILRIDQQPKSSRSSVYWRVGWSAFVLYTVCISAAMSLTNFVDRGPLVSKFNDGSTAIAARGHFDRRPEQRPGG